METSQRYIVRELTGYDGIGSSGPTTDVYVLDRWDCHEVVATYCGFASTVGRRRLEAGAVARKLEQDHRRWLAEERRGRVA